MSFEATIVATIYQTSGPHIADPQHVASWLVADGVLLDGGYGTLAFDACVIHPNPDECDHIEGRPPSATFQATLAYVDNIEPV
jgi:hypothetical protein